MKLPWWKRALSWVIPVRVAEASTPANPALALVRFRGVWQLETEDAMYSDTLRYRPLLAGYGAMGDDALRSLRDVLVLGCGLGSAAHMLHYRGLYPAITLVELDGQIAAWAEELLPPKAQSTVRIECADALRYIAGPPVQHDLLIVDLFIGRRPLPVVTTDEFWAHCCAWLRPGGWLIFNFILDTEEEGKRLEALLGAYFSEVRAISFEINRVFVARVAGDVVSA